MHRFFGWFAHEWAAEWREGPDACWFCSRCGVTYRQEWPKARPLMGGPDMSMNSVVRPQR